VSPVVIIYLVFLLIVAGLGTYFGRRYQKKLNTMVQAFATQKSLSYQPKLPPYDIVPEQNIFYGHASAADLLTDSAGSMTFFYNLQRSEGKTVIKTSFLAHKTVVAKQTSFTLIPTNVDMNFYREHDGLSPLKFESDDLNRIYRFLVKPGDEVDALELLAPDILLWLVKQAPSATLVARPGSLYVFMPTHVAPSSDNSTTAYEAQYNIINAIADYLVAHLSVQTTAPAPVPPVPTV
jgi:hypothetical protein